MASGETLDQYSEFYIQVKFMLKTLCMSKIARYISPAPPRLVNDKSKKLKNKKLKNLNGNKRKKFSFGDFILDTLWVSILAHPVVECHSSNLIFHFPLLMIG